MSNLDYIENYFSKTPDEDERLAFEKKIGNDQDFAEEVVYYLSVLQISREEAREKKKQEFREIYHHQRRTFSAPVKKMIYSLVAAAIVLGIIFGIYIYVKPDSPQLLAGKYVQQNLQTLAVTMSSRSDSLQTGLRLYNEDNLPQALVQFENMIQSDTANFSAKEYAGLTALRLKNYDKALHWFTSLESYRTLYANPALLFQAITLMQRNQSGDIARAKEILQQIMQQNAEGKEIAQEWLKKI